MKDWSNIFEQPVAVDQLRRAYRTDRLPHGIIFAGPVGVGKATTAAFLSQLFLCEKPNGDVPCGNCQSCKSLIAGGHPDYHIITKELIRYHDKTGKSKGIDLSINVIRPEVVEKASRKSSMGQGKVFIIEQAELMNPQAQNGLLKTLEEPAGRTMLILLTDQIGQILPTIRSRCQTIRFGLLAESTVIRELKARNIADCRTEGRACCRWLAGDRVEMDRRWCDRFRWAVAGTTGSNLRRQACGRIARLV